MRPLLGILLLAALAAGCGSSEDKPEPSIPAAATEQLNKELDALQRRFQEGGGACGDIQSRSRPDIEGRLQTLPDSVDSDVRSALDRSFERLFQLAEEQCDSEPEPTQTQEPEPVAPPPTTETTPPPTQTEERKPEKPEKPEKQEKPEMPRDGGGNDDGGGGGNDGESGGSGLPGSGG